MTKYAHLEISLRKREEHMYLVEFRYRPPNSAAETRPESGLVTIDLNKLQEIVLDDPGNYSKQYGVQLTRDLFANRDVLAAFSAARANAEAIQTPLRIRLLIHPDAAELHRIRWETLIDPRAKRWLSVDSSLLFSRYSFAQDYRPVKLKLKSNLRALVMVANPSNLPDYLAPIDEAREVEIARKGLGPIPCSILPDATTNRRATLDNLVTQLHAEEIYLVYLVCHGAFVRGEPWLWLEDEQGQFVRLPGQELAEAMGSLAVERPSLFVLASCQSAGDSAGDAMSSLGSLLANAGIPAVIAMQGQVTMETNTLFMTTFFKELQEHGIIDQAMTAGRQKIQRRPDFWMPVLYMRLDEGKLWSGFQDADAFNKWPSLISHIRRNKITPILGSGLTTPLFGSMRQLAKDWAQHYGYPMYEYERESLAQVAQYLSVTQHETFPGEELEKYARTRLQKEYKTLLPPELLQPYATLDDLIKKVGAIRRERTPWDAYKVLASLKLPVYITANYNYLLEAALEEMGSHPRTIISPWNEYIIAHESIYQRDKKEEFIPSPDEPIVYHPFGRLDELDTVVLTEDEYFKYLIGVTQNADLIPASIQESLTNKALLFLGFRLHDWDFRVLFQSLLSFEGEALRKHKKQRFVHIAVQIDPEGIANSERARNYLKDRFKEEDIHIYWGTPEDFIRELSYYLQANGSQT